MAFSGTQRYFSEVGNVGSEWAVVKVTRAAPQSQPPAQCAQDEFPSLSVLPFPACLQRKAKISVYVRMPSYFFLTSAYRSLVISDTVGFRANI